MPSTTSTPRRTTKTAAQKRRGSPRARQKQDETKKESPSRVDSVKAAHEVAEKVAEIRKAVGKRAHAPKRPSAKAGAAAAAVAAGISLACDIDKVRKGSMTKGEALEYAAWAGGEAAACTVATALVTTAAAPAIAAGTAALAGSSGAGTNAMAVGLAALGPLGVGLGVGLAISLLASALRGAPRGS